MPISRSVSSLGANASVDPHWSSVVSSLHFNGTHGSTTFTDVKGKTWSRNGSTTQITNLVGRAAFGGTSLGISASAGVAGGLSTPTAADWDFGADDFTLEMWAYNESYTNGSGNQQFLFSRYNGNGGPYLMQMLTTGQFQCLASNSTGSWVVNCSGGTIPLARWNHLAFTRCGPTFRCFINGTKVGEVTNNITLVVDTNAVWLGSTQLNNVLQWGGYIDDFRATKGVARYIKDFIPPQRQNVDFGFTPANNFVSYVTSLSPNYHSALGAVSSTNFYDDVAAAYNTNFTNYTTNGSSVTYTNAARALSNGPIPGRGKYVAMSPYPTPAGAGSPTNNNPIRLPAFSGGGAIPESFAVAIAIRPLVGSTTTGHIFSTAILNASAFNTFPFVLFWVANTALGNDQGAVGIGLSNGNDYSYDNIVYSQVGSAPAGKWAYIVVRVNTFASGGAVSLYVNGVKYTTTRTAAFNSASLGASLGAPWQHYAGGAVAAGTYFYGEMSECTVWTTSPSNVDDTAAANLYNRFRNAAGPANVVYSDPHINSVTALLHFNGTNGSTTFTDTSGKTWAAAGNAQLSTTSQYFGTACYLGDGTGDYIDYVTPMSTRAKSTGFGFGSGDYTVEFWIRPTSLSAVGTIFDNRSATDEGISIELSTLGKIFVNNNSTTMATGTVTLSINTWYHVAVSRHGTTVKTYINGGMDLNFTDSRTYALTAPCRIGANYAGNQSFNGRIDELRVTKGTARYTATSTTAGWAHTPQAVEFIDAPFYSTDPHINSVVALLHFDGVDGSTTFTDKVGSAWSAVSSGATLSAATRKFGGPTVGTTEPGSLALTGVNGIRTTENHATFYMGTSDLTVECWIYTSNVAQTACIAGQRNSSGEGWELFIGSDGSFYAQGTSTIVQSAASVLTANTWLHLAWTRQGGTSRIFLNGVLRGTGTVNTTDPGSTVYLHVGQTPRVETYAFNGFIDDFRITKGVARYVTNFAPPVSPFVDP